MAEDMCVGVLFGEIHTYKDLGLILTKMSITPPEPRSYTIDIPGRDGSLDLSESLTGDIRFKDRVITLTFEMLGNGKEIQLAYTSCMNAVHGRYFEHIVFDSDDQYYYKGRARITNLADAVLKGTITVKLTVEPYKYTWGNDWLWDTFPFETGYAEDIYEVHVEGSQEVIVRGLRKRYIPVIICSAAMIVLWESKEYQLKTGKNKITEMMLHEGDNSMIFKGSGRITIETVGGSL